MISILKKISAVILICLITLSIFAIPSFAAGSSVLVLTKKEMNIGDTFTATVNFSASDIGYLESTITYDSKVVQLVESNVTYNGSSGVTIFNLSSTGASKLSASFTFKAIAVGESTISVSDKATTYITYSDEKSGNAISGCSGTIDVKDKSASKSSNANLGYLRLSAGTLSPNFSANTTTYNVTVPNSVTEVLLYIGAEDKNARTDVEGSKTMKVGKNTRKVIVTAENGTVKTYTLNITRLAADGTTGTSSTETTEPTEKIIVDGEEKFISESFAQELIYEGFALSTQTYNDKEYPAITDGGTTLIYLVDEKGENGEFYRIDKQNQITKFLFITVGNNMYQLLDYDAQSDYIVTKVTIDGKEYDAYQMVSGKNEEFVFFYAKCANNTGLYRYDTVEKTMQRADGMMLTASNNAAQDEDDTDKNWIENIKNLNTNGKIVAITIVVILLLLVAAIIVILVKVIASRKEDFDDDYYDEESEEDLFEFDSVSISNNDNE